MHNKADVRPSAGSHMETPAALAASHTSSTLDFQKFKENARSVQPRSNVVSGNSHVDSIGQALSAVARIVGRTLGPHGANTLVRDEGGSHFATKDGYAVLQRLTFVQETATMVLDHVRSVSRALVRLVGDGSTSAVIMADSLYRSLNRAELNLWRFPPGAVQGALGVVADSMAKRIRAKARPMTEADVLTVATVSANNDPEAGRTVAEAYALGGSEANVFVAIGGNKTTVEAAPGYRVLRGMIDDCFANEADVDGASRTACRLRDAQVMVYDGVVDQVGFNTLIAKVLNACLSSGHPFVLVAREYTPDVVKIVTTFKRANPAASILFVDHAGATRRSAARLGDLAAVLNCQVSGPEGLSAQPTGTAVEVRSTGSETVFVLAGSATDAASERAKLIKEQIMRVDISNNAESMSEELEELRARVRALLGSEITISVGGATEQEKRTAQYLLDDAALAVAAARRSGVTEGLGLTPQRILGGSGSIPEEIVFEVMEGIRHRTRLNAERARELAECLLKALREAYADSTICVLENARLDGPNILLDCLANKRSYNVITGSREIGEIINPADTDIEILRGVVSIVGLFVSSDQTILTRPLAGGGLD